MRFEDVASIDWCDEMRCSHPGGGQTGRTTLQCRESSIFSSQKSKSQESIINALNLGRWRKFNFCSEIIKFWSIFQDIQLHNPHSVNLTLQIHKFPLFKCLELKVLIGSIGQISFILDQNT